MLFYDTSVLNILLMLCKLYKYFDDIIKLLNVPTYKKYFDIVSCWINSKYYLFFLDFGFG